MKRLLSNTVTAAFLNLGTQGSEVHTLITLLIL